MSVLSRDPVQCDRHRDVATPSLLEVWIDGAERLTWFLFGASRNAGGM